MNEQKHIIMREVLEVTVPDRANALPIQNKFSEIVKYRLNPALDKLFSEISPSDEIVRFNKLEIDLGVIQSEKLDEELIIETVKRVEDQIANLILEQKEKSKNRTNASNLQEVKESLEVLSTELNYINAFVHFLNTGQLPWWKKTDTPDILDKILTEVLKADKNVLKAKLFPLFKNVIIRNRLIYQFKDNQVEELLRVINDSAFQEFSKLYTILKPVWFDKRVSQKQLKGIFQGKAIEWISYAKYLKSEDEKIEFLQTVLYEYVSEQPDLNQKYIIGTGFSELIKESKIEFTSKQRLLTFVLISTVYKLQLNLETVLKESGAESLLHESLFSDYIEKLEQNQSQIKVSDSERVKSGETNLIERNEYLTESLGKEKSGKAKKEQEFYLFKNKHEDEILISNAGLVILYPFLKYFFDGLGLLNSDFQFTGKQSAYKAVHLLQYIVNENNENPEYELALNKILCGLDVYEPVPREVSLSDFEKEECESVIQAVLKHWKVLKTKKTEAIRETFLNREGILSFGNQGWILKVERNTFDVLLDKLPWGVSIIKLPWSPQILYVEW